MDERKKILLERSVPVFLRYGFKKTSMDEVARATGISRQALYLHFPNKEDLFRETILHLFQTSLLRAEEILDDPTLSELDKFTKAIGAWIGPSAGKWDSQNADLVEMTYSLLQEEICSLDERFANSLTKTLESSECGKLIRSRKKSLQDVAKTMTLLAKGARMSVSEDFETLLRASLETLLT